MNYNQTLPTPTCLEQWMPHIYELDISRNEKGNIVIKFSEMGVTIALFELTPKMRDGLVKILMQA